MASGVSDEAYEGTGESAVHDAAEANHRRYADGQQVGKYLVEPYHKLRLDLAVDLMVRHCHPTGGELTIADIGAGSSDMSRRLSSAGYRVLACDVETEALEAIRHTDCAATVVRMDATKAFPFRSGSFDGIYSGELIEHLFRPDHLLSECRRVLRPGGVLVLTTPNLAALQDRLQFLAGHSPRHINMYHEYLRLHIRPFSYHALAAALYKEGLKPIDLRSNYIVWRARGKRHDSRLAARLLPRLGGTLVVAAVKL